MIGAIDFEECPKFKYPVADPRHGKACRCGKCVVCGFVKHSAIHGPMDGGLPGSKAWGHEFIPKQNYLKRKK